MFSGSFQHSQLLTNKTDSDLVRLRSYKQDLTVEQKDALLETLRAKIHPQITPEIRREIVSSVARGEKMVFDDGSMEVEVL